MYRYVVIMLGIVCASVVVSGCSETTATTTAAVSSPQFQLHGEPDGALEVLDAKGQAQDGQPVVVVGRVGGGVNPWIDGRAAFLLVDTRILPSCGDGDHCEEGCRDCTKEMTEAGTMVKFLGDDGKVLPIDARTLLGLKERQTVVIEGVASRDSTGNVTVNGKGIYIRR